MCDREGLWSVDSKVETIFANACDEHLVAVFARVLEVTKKAQPDCALYFAVQLCEPEPNVGSDSWFGCDFDRSQSQFEAQCQCACEEMRRIEKLRKEAGS
jgi:hypothetical protein